MISDAQKWFLLAVLVVSGYLIYLLAPILTPFMISALLAYLGDPVTDGLEAKKLSRTLAVVIVFFIMFIILMVILFIIFPLLEEQLSGLLQRIPEIFNYIQSSLIPSLSERLAVDLSSINLQGARDSLSGHWQTLGNVVSKLMTKLSESGQAVLLWVSNLILIPIVTFYLLRDWDHLVAGIAELIPRKYFADVKTIASECDAVLAEFLRA